MMIATMMKKKTRMKMNPRRANAAPKSKQPRSVHPLLLALEVSITMRY